MCKDGRKNWDTTTAVFEYGPQNDATSGFQVTFSSRMQNGSENPAEIYYANGGKLNLSPIWYPQMVAKEKIMTGP